MQEQLNHYFAGEKLGALAFGLAGAVAVIVSIAVWRSAASYRAMLYPLLIVAAVELGVCGVLQLRTDSRVERLSAQLRADPGGLRQAELQRLQGVLLGFKIIEVVEIALFAGGLFLVFRMSRSQAAFSVGLGLLLQASAMLVCDLGAERRAIVYAEALKSARP